MEKAGHDCTSGRHKVDPDPQRLLGAIRSCWQALVRLEQLAREM